MSGTHVYRIEAGSETLFLKVASGFQAREVAGERARMIWLQGRLPVPQIHFFDVYNGMTYLLMSAIPGQDASQQTLPLSPDAITRLLAEGMHLFHSVPIDGCPFDQSLDKRIAAVRERPEPGGRVDESDFDNLLRTRPASEDLVFTHGDYCLPNILLDGQTPRITGFVDLSRAGIADRHQDIALCARSLAYNLGEEWVPLLFDSYGREFIDPAKIAYYKLLDKFF